MRASVVAAIVAVACAARPTFALTDKLLDNDAGTGVWETAANWQNDGEPGTTHRAKIIGTHNVTLGSGRHVGRLDLGDGATLVLTDASLTLDEGLDIGTGATVSSPNGYDSEIYLNGTTVVGTTAAWTHTVGVRGRAYMEVNDFAHLDCEHWLIVGADHQGVTAVNDHADIDIAQGLVLGAYNNFGTNTLPSRVIQTGGSVDLVRTIKFSDRADAPGGTYDLRGGVLTVGDAAFVTVGPAAEDRIIISGPGALVVPGDWTGDLTVGGYVEDIDGGTGLLAGAFDDVSTTITVAGVAPEPADLGLIGVALLGLRKRRSRD